MVGIAPMAGWHERRATVDPFTETEKKGSDSRGTVTQHSGLKPILVHGRLQDHDEHWFCTL
jgi:hypothetical protein